MLRRPASGRRQLSIDCAQGLSSAAHTALAASAGGPTPPPGRLQGRGSDVDGIVVSYRWDSGDGETAATLDTHRLYAKPGSYTATLTVTDDRGAASSASVAVRVTAK